MRFIHSTAAATVAVSLAAAGFAFAETAPTGSQQALGRVTQA